jgi:chromosome segregation ATPase
VADRTDPETGLTPEDMLDVIADAQVDSAALQHRIRALEAERDALTARLDLIGPAHQAVQADRNTLRLRAEKAESRSAALEEALRGLAERWGRVAEGGLTAHDAHTMLSEVRALASGTGAGT